MRVPVTALGFAHRPSPYGNTYKFNNKPNGLLHWGRAASSLRASAAGAEASGRGITNTSTAILRSNDVVVLIDPDFMFMARHVFFYSNMMLGSGSSVLCKRRSSC